jgi:hypothetical protein
MSEDTANTTASSTPDATGPQGPSYGDLEASLRQAHAALEQSQATINELHSALKAALLAGGTLARVR